MKAVQASLLTNYAVPLWPTVRTVNQEFTRATLVQITRACLRRGWAVDIRITHDPVEDQLAIVVYFTIQPNSADARNYA